MSTQSEPSIPFAPQGELAPRRRLPPTRYLLAAELLLAALLGIVTIGRRSFFLDETVSVTIAKLPWHQFTHIVRTREGNMVLYHLLLSGWMHLGSSEAVVRLLSVIAFVASVAALYWLARRLAGQRVALLAGLLLAVDPFMIRYAQTARGYELSVLLVTCATLLFARALERQTWGAWLSYSLVAALGVYAHFFALLIPAAHALSLICVPPERLRWRKLLGAAGALLVFLLPFFYLLSQNASSGVEWSAGNPIGRLFTKLHEHPPLAALFLLLCAALAIASVLLLRRWRGSAFRSQESWRWALPLCWLIVPPAIVVVVAVVVRPLFVPYYFMVCLPAAVLLAALLIERLRAPQTVLAVGLTAILLLGSLADDARWYHSGSTEEWRGATRYVIANDRPGDGVMFVAPYVRLSFGVYLDRESKARRSIAPKPVYPSAPFGSDEIRFDYYIPISAQDVRSSAARFSRIWLVASHTSINGQVDQRYTATLRGLGEAGFSAGPRRKFAGVTIVLYESHRSS
ncbi:MAG TPA: glycosyltransferase family 39 protein [Solirubrobacteraceae bacterium]|jgi:mannosyltransferase